MTKTTRLVKKLELFRYGPPRGVAVPLMVSRPSSVLSERRICVTMMNTMCNRYIPYNFAGVSLPAEQWQNLKAVIEEVDERLRQMS